VQPGQERKFLDYAYPPLYPYNVVTNIGGRVGWQPMRLCARNAVVVIRLQSRSLAHRPPHKRPCLKSDGYAISRSNRYSWIVGYLRPGWRARFRYLR
jgi:hypothetical protein